MLRALGRLAVVAVALTGAVWSTVELGPSIDPRQRLPHDVALLTASTFDRFRAAFPGQVACLTDVELELVDDVDGGAARYVESERLILIEIPTSPRRYVESLIHELAHHLDAGCDAEPAIGAAIKRSQGIEPQVPWQGTDEWEARPTEHYAETVVEYVTGDRYTHADVIDVSEEALDVVRAWAAGGG